MIKNDFEASRWKFSVNMYANYSKSYLNFKKYIGVHNMVEGVLIRYQESMKKIREEWPQFSKVFDDIDKENGG